MIYQKVLTNRFIPVLIQTAEAHRKPRWLPVAKSKVFRIPKRPEVSEEERLELLRLNNNYKTQMRAIRRFYHEQMHDKSTRESASSELSLRLEAEEWEKCVELNKLWNTQVALEREERRKLEVLALDEYALKRMEKKDAIHRKKVENASKEIKKEKELSKTFITPETLDAAIEHAIANPTDYNYAIDLKGNQYIGRDTPITPPKLDGESTAV